MKPVDIGILVLFYVIASMFINSFFMFINIFFTVNFKLPKKYKNKKNPIYKFDIDENLKIIQIFKYTLELAKYDTFLIILLPIPIKFFTYQYVLKHTCVINYDQDKQLTYDELASICENDYAIEDKKIKEKENIKNKIVSYNQELNKVFDENYFG